MIIEFFVQFWEVIVVLILMFLFYKILKNGSNIKKSNEEILELLESITKDIDSNFKVILEIIKEKKQ